MKLMDFSELNILNAILNMQHNRNIRLELIASKVKRNKIFPPDHFTVYLDNAALDSEYGIKLADETLKSIKNLFTY